MKTLPIEQQDAIMTAKGYLKSVSELLIPSDDLHAVDREELAALCKHLSSQADGQPTDRAEEAKACLMVVVELMQGGEEIDRGGISLLLAYCLNLLDDALNMPALAA